MIILQHTGGTSPTSEGFVDEAGNPPAPGSTTGSAWNVSGSYDFDYDLYNLTSANATALASAATWTFSATFNNLSAGTGLETGSYACVLVNGIRIDLGINSDGSGDQVLSLDLFTGTPDYTITGLGTGAVSLTFVYDNSTQMGNVYVNGVEVLSGYAGYSQGGAGSGAAIFGGVDGDFSKVELQTGSSIPPEIINLPPGNNTLAVTDMMLSPGVLTINDGSFGNNTISAAGDTSASKGKTLVYNAGTGTDSFTGGFENDQVHVSTSAVGGDTLTGGSGNNTLALSNAGTANLGGVSRFATIDLAAGENTVTLTDTTLSGGTVALHDGASGINTVSAAGDTSASKGKTLVYFTGAGTDYFTGGFENDAVHVSAATVGGDTLAGGSGVNTLILTSAGAVNLGGVNTQAGVSKFGTINLAAGNSTVTVTDKTLSGGTVVLSDAASGNNTVSAASDTSASKGKTLNYFTGTGTDSFTGGFESDQVHVSAAAVGGDTLTGGSGANTLILTSAGPVNLGGVSKFGAIDLATGNSTVTVTDTTLSGGTVVLRDAASGNNTVSAASDTSASKGKVLNYFTGPGTDSFTGGFENDQVHASAAAVGGDTLSGGSGNNTLALSNAGTANLGGVSRFGTIYLAAGNSTVTVTDATLSGGSVTIDDGGSGNNTVSAATDTSASKGKTLTYLAGTGTDSFAGGFEIDSVHVSAAAVGGDTLTGGSGANILTLTSTLTVNLAGVSKFGTIDLAAGNSTVIVTDKTLSGGSMALHDGASGNNTVNAAFYGTSASTGKTLTYYAGTGTDSFAGGFEIDSVHVSAAAVGGDTLTGGSGVNTLTLTSAGAINLGGVSKFGSIDLAAGNSAVTVTDTTLSGGTVVLRDAASGNNTVSAASDTSASTGKALNFFAGTGTDSFTGGFENDQVHVSAAAVGGDTLTGGSGANILYLASAGPVNLGGVSKFATIELAAGNSTVTVTDTTLSGGTVVLRDAASGNNTVSAASDTSASTGKSLAYYAGAGTDSFTGGFENDTIYAGTGSGTYTAGSGHDTMVFINDNLPSQTFDNFLASADSILVYGIHSSGGFDLGSVDNGLNPTTPTLVDVASFVANASGDFTNSSQRFAYDTTNGQLHYSATGSNSAESLVATLAGAPDFTAGNLLFEH